jgi:hypothetical protein
MAGTAARPVPVANDPELRSKFVALRHHCDRRASMANWSSAERRIQPVTQRVHRRKPEQMAVNPTFFR